MATNGIDFVIGGKDQAKPAMNAVEKSLAKLEQKTDSVAKSTASLTSVSKTLAAAYALVKTALAALSGLDKINAAFDAQAAAIKRLNASLNIRGQGQASAQFQAIAKDLEKLTGVSDQTTLALMQQAQSMGFATDRMDDAAKAAIGLAEATGKTAEESLTDLKAALEGNFDAFIGLNPQIMLMRSNQERMAAVLAIANQGLGVMSNNASTVSGSGLRANTAITSLMETMGKIIAPIRVLINAGLQQLSESLQSVLAPAAEYAQSILANIGPIIDFVKEKVVQGVNLIISAFTFLETILTNLNDVWDMAAAYAESAMISMKENIMHVLTVAIPEYTAWFAENFVNLFRDAFNAVIAVITNAGKIIGDMIYEIFAFIASGGQGGIDGLMQGLGQAASRSLLDGFESSLTPLPEIAERQLTQREKDLADKMGAIGSRLGQEFSDKMEERMVGVGSTLGDEVQAAASGINLQGRAAVITQGVSVTEGRLLTRGPGTTIPNKLDQIIGLLRNPPEQKTLEGMRNDTKAAFDALKREKRRQFELEFVQ